MKFPHPSLKNLIGCERGNVLMTFGLTSMIAAAAVGGSVDFGRSYHMKSKMQNALDSAVTSGIAKYRESGNWESAKTHAAAVFQAIFTDAISPVAGQPTPTAGLDQPVVSFTQTGTQLAGTATVRANTPFMNMIIGENLQLTATSSAIPATGKMLEVALMVDLTGSMGWDAASGAASTPCNSVASPREKIDFLKCAYEDLLNIMLPTSGVNNDSVRIGVAPFADYVNAGTYASAATGLAAEGGAYANITNLASTRQRSSFSGTYSGYTAGTGTGNGYGAMGQSATSGSTATAGGATYTNGYCSNPGGAAAFMWTRDSLTYGVYVPIASNNSYTGSAPTGLMKASSGSNYARANRWNMTYGAHYSYSDNLYWYSQTSSGYYAPMVANSSQLTIQTNNADGHLGNVGVGVYYTGSSNDPTVPAYLKKNTSGFWRVTGIKSDGTFNMVWDDDQSSSEYTYYLPIYTSHTTAATSGCESVVETKPSSKLISCVTERKNGNALDYTDDAPATSRYIGAYNHGDTSKANYSSDGRCMVAGRELPSVIPLTNSRTTLENFIDNATVGGATPGHLGTAWAQYLLSPDWSSVWPSDSIPASYSNTGVKKAAILMTDGEYNLQFSMAGSTSNISAKQALMLCKQMRDNGVHVYTVGFGFAANATPPTTNVEGMSDADRTTPAGTTANSRALDVLAKCASSNSSYYFPYDGESLRTTFKSIANGLTAEAQGGKARLTN